MMQPQLRTLDEIEAALRQVREACIAGRRESLAYFLEMALRECEIQREAEEADVRRKAERNASWFR